MLFSSSSFSFVLVDPCGRDGVREHQRERTRADGTEPARHRPHEMVPASADRDGAARPLWPPRNRPLAALAGAWKSRAAKGAAGLRYHLRIAGTTQADPGWRGGSARQ